MGKIDAATQRLQLQEQRRKVDFDSYDITVDELVRRVSKKRIEIAPAYQRQFRWDEQRQSRLIESLLLGIPVPPLFMATNVDTDRGTTWEVVDGLQRLLSLTNFLGDDTAREVARLGGKALRLTELEKLDSMQGSTFGELPADIRTGLEDRPIKVIVLNDKSDLQVRFDLFERLNTGGVRLTDHEVRECVFMGDFIDLVSELSQSEEFKRVVLLPKSSQQDGTAQDYVLRFFAFVERYQSFDHSVKDFLNDFCGEAARNPRREERAELFHRTFALLAATFPDGLRSRKGTTPVNLFEGVAAGAALALLEEPLLQPLVDTSWISSDEMKKLTTGATNNRSRVSGRVEISKRRFLRAQ
ncbi:DUF262 domain-containing protein [Pseudarthrobacter sp. RMG13]|uniref:DUF262 domain-containing protein n=1 Tax=Pseudarthrobacter humi TaxID=2952523 RepID=A0ABT1LKB0_9MICC|nr:DUF262 domain-containing protein [Pseudarthrobacter humi]MCP8998276.1 DUF262 domain-containing protein [Pseudarthrobacter humi]